ncbi:MAG: aminotransferase V [Acidobacteria bacterium]|nr:MAG: aminotransferase V [Acidobacteriota bacterium]PYR53575.1 MAG: aminotransferase V [Acidobacteriota bacterium]
MLSRRSVLRLAGSAAGAAFAVRNYGIDEVAAATAAVESRSPEEVAADETYWREIQFAFTLDRSLINLNNGNSCPSPTVVHEAYKRYLDSSNQAPVYHRGLIERNIETARRRLAAEFGADPEEIAITRNASESLQIAQNGLDFKPGDEIITTEQDYGRMLTTWDQRARRDKIKVTRLDFPCPTTQADLLQRFEKAITPQTRVLHFCHITNQSGQLFPVRDLSRLARQRGITTIVDGAHAMGHFPFKLRDLEMDFYGVSLHKWLLAPTGTGLLYVRKDRIASTWPLQAAPERRDNDIRKFEEIGTSPAATKAAINEAIAFQQAIGIERKAARLRYLTLRWANELKKNPRIKLHSSLEPGQTWGLAVVSINGVDSNKLVTHLWDKYRIVIVSVGHDNEKTPSLSYHGLRVTPNIYTPLEEVDTFVEAMQNVVKNGLPS